MSSQGGFEGRVLPDPLRLCLQEQGCAASASMLWSTTCPAPVDIPADQGHRLQDRRRNHPQGLGRRAPFGAGVQDHGRPVRGLAHLLPHLFRQAGDGRGPPQLDARQARAGRPYAAHALQQSRRHQGGLCWRHRRSRGPEGYPHGRHPVRPEQEPGDPGEDELPGPGDRDRHRAEVQGRPGKAGRGPRQDGRRRPVLHRRSPTRSRARRS